MLGATDSGTQWEPTSAAQPLGHMRRCAATESLSQESSARATARMHLDCAATQRHASSRVAAVFAERQCRRAMLLRHALVALMCVLLTRSFPTQLLVTMAMHARLVILATMGCAVVSTHANASRTRIVLHKTTVSQARVCPTCVSTTMLQRAPLATMGLHALLVISATATASVLGHLLTAVV